MGDIQWRKNQKSQRRSWLECSALGRFSMMCMSAGEKDGTPIGEEDEDRSMRGDSVIDEDRTMQIFGYTSDELSLKSAKRVMAVCDECGKHRSVIKFSYRELCNSCAHKGARSHWYGVLGKDNPNFGRNHTEETKHKISASMIGANNHFFGKHHTEETKLKLSERIVSDDTKLKISKNHADFSGANNPFFGKHHTEETKKLLSDTNVGVSAGKKNPMYGVHLSGPLHWNWQGGITPIITAVRNSQAYKNWREQVFKRDDYTCRICNVRGGDIHAHHIYPVRDTKNSLLIYAIDNGITLCEGCHKETFGKEYDYVGQFKSMLIGI